MKYNLLGKTGVLVSEICLGAMTFGGKGYWQAIGQLPQEEVNKLIKQFEDTRKMMKMYGGGKNLGQMMSNLKGMQK